MKACLNMVYYVLTIIQHIKFKTKAQINCESDS